MDKNKNIYKKLFEQAYLSVFLTETFNNIRKTNLNEAVLEKGLVPIESETTKISLKGLTAQEHDGVIRNLKSSIPEIVKNLDKEIFGNVMYAYKESSPKTIVIDKIKYIVLLKYKSTQENRNKFLFDNISLIEVSGESNTPKIYDMPDGEKATLVKNVNDSKKTAKIIEVTDDELKLKHSALKPSNETVEEPVKKTAHRVGKDSVRDKGTKIELGDDGEYEINGSGLDTSEYDYDEAEFGRKKEKPEDSNEKSPEDIKSGEEEKNEIPEEPIKFKKSTKAAAKKEEKLKSAGITKDKLIDLIIDHINKGDEFNYKELNGSESVQPTNSLHVDGVNFIVNIQFKNKKSVSGVSVFDSASMNDVILDENDRKKIFSGLDQSKLKELRRGLVDFVKNGKKEIDTDTDVFGDDSEEQKEEGSELDTPRDANTDDENITPDEVNNKNEYSEEDVDTDDSMYVSIDSEKYANVKLKTKKTPLHVNRVKALISKLKELDENDFNKYRVSDDIIKLVPKNEKGLVTNNSKSSYKDTPILVYNKNEEGDFDLTHIGLKTVREQKNESSGVLLDNSQFNEVKSSGINVPLMVKNDEDTKVLTNSDEISFPEYDDNGSEIKPEKSEDKSDLQVIFKEFASRFKKTKLSDLKTSLTSIDTYRVTKKNESVIGGQKFKLGFDLKIGDDDVLHLTNISVLQKTAFGEEDFMATLSQEQKQEALDVFNEVTKGKFNTITLEEFDRETKSNSRKQKDNNEVNNGEETVDGTVENGEETFEDPEKESDEVTNDAPEENLETSKIEPENKFKKFRSQDILNTIIQYLNSLDVSNKKLSDYSGDMRSFIFKFSILGVEGAILLILKKDENNKFHPIAMSIKNSNEFFPNESKESLDNLIKNSLDSIETEKYNIDKFLKNPYEDGEDNSKEKDSETTQDNEPEEEYLKPLNFNNSNEEPQQKNSFKDKVKNKYKELLQKYKNRKSSNHNNDEFKDDDSEYDDSEYDNGHGENPKNDGNPNSFMGKSGRLVNKAFNQIGKAAYNTGKAIKQGGKDFKAGYASEKEKNKNQDHNKFYNQIKNNAGRNINRVTHAVRNLSEGEEMKMIIDAEINKTIIKKIDFMDVDFKKVK